MHYGLAWVVLDSPSIDWALVAGLSLLMLPSLFRSLDACRGFHLEKANMTTQVTSNNHPWDVLEKLHKMCHFCRGSVTKQVLISLTLHQLTHLSGLGCSRLHFNRCDLSWHRFNLTFQQNNSVKIERKG